MPAQIDPGIGAQGVIDTRLSGGWLLCARIVTVGVIVLALGVFALSSAARFAQLLTLLALPARHRSGAPALPAVGYRPDHQPHAGLQYPDVYARRDLPGQCWHLAIPAERADGTDIVVLDCRLDAVDRLVVSAAALLCIQTIIERRFYRSKYDAARTLAAFGEKLSYEVDLEQLSEQLLKVVNETMQPTRVSLWLRPIERERSTTTRPLEIQSREEREPQ
ncbi:MAG: hypothetical protein ABI324_26135 [Ktedonobacteraceae bacterium]